jgi:hypothetical protein
MQCRGPTGSSTRVTLSPSSPVKQIPKSTYNRSAITSEEYIIRLQITVNDAMGVGERDTGAYLQEHLFKRRSINGSV